MGLTTLKLSTAAPQARAINSSFPSFDMHPLYLAPQVTTTETRKPYTTTKATPLKKKKKQHVRPEEAPFRSYKYAEEKRRNDFGNLRNQISDLDLSILLAMGTAKTGVSDTFFDTLISWDISCDRCLVRFSERFSALWFRRGANSVVWLCVIDGDFFSFSVSTRPTSSADNVPEVVLPSISISWGEFQQDLVDRFYDDNHVRAIAAAVMLMCSPIGENKGVAEELLPESLRYYSHTHSVNYDVAIDEDMVTVLSDAKTSDQHTLFFECTGGYSAKSNCNDKLGRLTRINPQEVSQKFLESSQQLMPFMFT